MTAVLRYLWSAAAGARWRVALLMLLGIARVGIMLAVIWVSKLLVDSVTQAGSSPSIESLVAMSAAMAAMMLTNVGLIQAMNYLEARSILRMRIRNSRRLYGKLMRARMEGGRFSHYSGDLINRLTEDVTTLAKCFGTTIPDIIITGVQLVGAFSFLYVMSPGLALAVVTIMPLCILAAKAYFRRMRRLTGQVRDLDGSIITTMQEGLRHRGMLQSLGGVDVMNSRLVALQGELDATGRGSARLSFYSGLMMRIGFVSGYLTAFIWGVFDLRAGLITFGSMTAFLQLVSRVQAPVANLASYIPSLIGAYVAVERLSDIDSIDVDEGGQDEMLNAPVGVRISNLTFGYDASSDGNSTGERNVVYRNFSHDFTPGSATLVVGRTGAGKSTLIKLLLSLLTPQDGEISIYDAKRCISVSSSTRCNFVYVPQGYTLLHGTIRENLLVTAPEATDDEMEEALHAAVADFVHELPHGLDTMCDEQKGGLSEGQAQRIAIARALLQRGKVMLLDEYNSALDEATATELTSRIIACRPEATLIVISHRPLPIKGDILTIDSPHER